MSKFYIYQAYIKQNYTGEVLVAAENAEEATVIIKNFQKSDPNNELDSYGINSHFDESDVIEGIYAEKKGIIFNTIMYAG